MVKVFFTIFSCFFFLEQSIVNFTLAILVEVARVGVVRI